MKDVKKETKQLDCFDEILEKMVKKDHTYRKLMELVDFDKLQIIFMKTSQSAGFAATKLMKTRQFIFILENYAAALEQKI